MPIVDTVLRFYEFTKTNPAWTLATAVFVPVFWFTLSVFQQIPAHLSEAEKNGIRFERHRSEQDKIQVVYSALSSALASFVQTMNFYEQRVAGHLVTEDLEADLILLGAQLAGTTRERIAVAMGTIEGTSFEDSRLQNYKIAWEKDVTYIQTLAVSWQEFFLLQALGHKGEALKIAKGMNDPDKLRASAAMLERNRQFGELGLFVLREHRQELNEAANKRRAYEIALLSAFAGLVYMVGYTAIAVTTIYRLRATKQKLRSSRR